MSDVGAAGTGTGGTTDAAERFLDGRHAIVTGGGRGIGAAIAEALARRGAAVTITGRSRDALREHAALLRARYATPVLAAECDVSDGDSVLRAFSFAIAELGPAYALVNNAGQGESAAFAAMSRDTWDRMIGVNLTGTYLCTAQVLPAMLEAGEGRVVNVASTAGLRGYKTMSAYCAAKHGVIGLTRALALETAARGVTVNAVCPGYTDTDMTQHALDNLVAARGVTRDEAMKMLLRSTPRGRLTSTAEVASAVEWLCSAGAAAVTGVALPVAGGEIG